MLHVYLTAYDPTPDRRNPWYIAFQLEYYPELLQSEKLRILLSRAAFVWDYARSNLPRWAGAVYPPSAYVSAVPFLVSATVQCRSGVAVPYV
jgi:hypothetical protein